MRRVLVGMLLAAVLVGCSGPPAPAPPVAVPSVTSSVPTDTALPEPQPRPVSVAVPGRDVSGEVLLEGLGVDEDGGFAEPPLSEPMLASWYNPGPVPGERGPSVVLGHVNGNGQDGIFANLQSVVEGDRIVVTREDGSLIEFEVYRTQLAEKVSFPVMDVFGSTSAAEIRLITCGGDLDREAGHYLSNVIVYGRLIL